MAFVHIHMAHMAFVYTHTRHTIHSCTHTHARGTHDIRVHTINKLKFFFIWDKGLAGKMAQLVNTLPQNPYKNGCILLKLRPVFSTLKSRVGALWLASKSALPIDEL